jgi:hypothetical protein
MVIFARAICAEASSTLHGAGPDQKVGIRLFFHLAAQFQAAKSK